MAIEKSPPESQKSDALTPHIRNSTTLEIITPTAIHRHPAGGDYVLQYGAPVTEG